jgi:hypothetical protein
LNAQPIRRRSTLSSDSQKNWRSILPVSLTIPQGIERKTTAIRRIDPAILQILNYSRHMLPLRVVLPHAVQLRGYAIWRIALLRFRGRFALLLCSPCKDAAIKLAARQGWTNVGS